MLQIEDFRLIEQLYLQPKLGLKNEESNSEFQLMIKSTQTLNKLKKQTYLAIVKDIYYEHYLAWYEVVEAENEEAYQQHIDQQYTKIEESLNHVSEINLTIQSPICKFYKALDCHYNSTAGFITNEEGTKNRPLLLLGIPMIITLAFLVSYFLYFLLNKFNLDSQVFAAIFAAITALCTGIVAVSFSKVPRK